MKIENLANNQIVIQMKIIVIILGVINHIQKKKLLLMEKVHLVNGQIYICF